MFTKLETKYSVIVKNVTASLLKNELEKVTQN